MGAFIDARSGDADDMPQADVCIIGAGAAGITIARDLAASGASVILLESGGEGINGPTQRLYGGDNVGLKYYDLSISRLRYFGGTTNHWGGYCAPFEPWHFLRRPDAGLPGWPIGYDEVRPWYERASEQLGLDFSRFGFAGAMEALGQDTAELPNGDPEARIRARPQQISKRRRFAREFGAELLQNDVVRPVLFANVVRILTSDNGAYITGVAVRTLNERNFTVRARHYVLACHAIENARLLMVSDDVVSSGLGNRYDHVGRYFMEHPHIHGSRFVPSGKPLPKVFADNITLREHGTPVSICLKPEICQAEGLLHAAVRLNPVYEDDTVRGTFSSLKKRFFSPFDSELMSDIAEILSDPMVSARFVGQKLGMVSGRRVAWYEMEQAIEQAPNPDSRVVLSDRKDALGLPVADLHWALNHHDFHTFRRVEEIVGQDLSALGYGRMARIPLDDAAIRDQVEGHWHHIGTTRMSGSAKDGVVDRNCRVHGTENLYVAGSSVFASSGASPTLLIVAMARRLADHIAQQLAA